MSGDGKGGKASSSSQMDAVMRLMTGKEERTIAEKFADSNRPTWEQYKKDNEDKLNLEGMDEKKMQEYRQQLDQERDKLLTRGLNHGAKKKKRKRRDDDDDHHHNSSDSQEDSGRRRRHSKKKRRKKERRRKHKKHSDSDEDSESSESSSDDSRRKKRYKKKKRKDKKKTDQEEGVMDDRYRLSNFFTKDDSDDKE
jgi:hypothetical protein